jgi:3-oxoacyl-[acyl-carrier-protein] synthase II
VAIESPLAITGLGALSALGSDIASHRRAVEMGNLPFQPLGRLLGPDSPHAALPGAWIQDRSLLNHRKWSPASMAALHVAGEAIRSAGWPADDLCDAALVLGTSRGNAAGWLGPWPGRRPFKLMAASNTIHSEPATAITIAYGITGPCHVLASGCAAGLDAVGIAMMLVRAGVAPRALAVAVDLPLVPMLLDNYAASGLLTSSFRPDPYAESASGFIPAEGAAALAIQPGDSGISQLLHYGCNSDAADPVGIPRDGGRTPLLFEKLSGPASDISAVCPHATGTAVQRQADPAMLRRVFPDGGPGLHPLKPLVGHAIGASGLLETAILCSFLGDGLLPPNPPGLHAPRGFVMPESCLPVSGAVAKTAHGMGGHNALLVISAPRRL